jgi:S-adenosylmethionine decarboxylase
MSAGKHFIIELADVPSANLENITAVQDVLETACKKGNMTVLNRFFHKFNPQGVTGIIALAESHLSIHTWPEDNYAAIDIFVCGDANPEEALQHIVQNFKGVAYVRRLQRGKEVRG